MAEMKVHYWLFCTKKEKKTCFKKEMSNRKVQFTVVIIIIYQTYFSSLNKWEWHIY